MKSLQDYINTYRSIANGLGIKGDSSELLIQLLANATYISEVENIAYSQEASLERATMINSKIQHSIDNMYSVYRGQCPRVILNIKPTKNFTWKPFDELIVSNNFKVYYLGYYEDNKFNYNTLTVYPGNNKKIIGLLAKETASVERDISKSENKYYIDFLEDNLSNDMKVEINGSKCEVTRIFSDHVLHNKVFDLTLPSFGSRIYFNQLSNKEIKTEQDQNTKIKLFYFKRSSLASYNESELKKLNIKGTEIEKFDDKWLSDNNYTELAPGIIPIPEIESDDLLSIHYKANQLRHLGTILKSNSSLGELLEQVHTDTVSDTSVVFEGVENKLYIYYIPKESSKTLSEEQIKAFINDYKAYYIANDINIGIGTSYNINFDIEVELYETGDVSESIKNILEEYSNKFDINFIKSSQNALIDKYSVLSEIETRISKLSLVKRINKLNLQYSTVNGDLFEENIADDLWNLMIDDLIQKKAYYNINSSISQII